MRKQFINRLKIEKKIPHTNSTIITRIYAPMRNNKIRISAKPEIFLTFLYISIEYMLIKMRLIMIRESFFCLF